MAELKEQWVFDSKLPGRGTEATPLYFDGRLYVTGLAGHAWALDARTGLPSWTYRREYPTGMANCCGAINRGLGALGDTLYMGTLDARLIALKVSDGTVMWEAPVADPSKGYSITMAPLVVKDKVIVGVSGSEFPTRGFIDAYDARTGDRAWRFYTVPAPGEPGSETWPSAESMAKGGGGVWVAGSYDPESNTVFYGTGNPNPGVLRSRPCGRQPVHQLARGARRRLRQAAVALSIHAARSARLGCRTGARAGDAASQAGSHKGRHGRQPQWLLLRDRSRQRESAPRAAIRPDRMGERSGADGRLKILNDLGTPDACIPDHRGATNFPPPSYDPARRLFFVTARETCATYNPGPPNEPPPGKMIFTMGRGPQRVDGRDSYLVLRALDAVSGEKKWEVAYTPLPSTRGAAFGGGVLSTASGLVFAADDDGNFRAVNSDDGRVLWQAQVGASPAGAAPMTYMLNGRQWIVVAAGATIRAYARPE